MKKFSGALHSVAKQLFEGRKKEALYKEIKKLGLDFSLKEYDEINAFMKKNKLSPKEAIFKFHKDINANPSKIAINSTLIQASKIRNLKVAKSTPKQTDKFLEIVSSSENQEGYTLSAKEFNDLLKYITIDERENFSSDKIFAKVDTFIRTKKADFLNKMKKSSEGVRKYSEETEEYPKRLEPELVFKERRPSWVPSPEKGEVYPNIVSKSIQDALKDTFKLKDKIDQIERMQSMALDKYNKKMQELQNQIEKAKTPFVKKIKKIQQDMAKAQELLKTAVLVELPKDTIQKWEDILVAHLEHYQQKTPKQIKKDELKAALIQRYGDKMKKAIESIEDELIDASRTISEAVVVYPETQKRRELAVVKRTIKTAGILEWIKEKIDHFINFVKGMFGFWQNANEELDQIDAELSDVDETPETEVQEDITSAKLNRKSDSDYIYRELKSLLNKHIGYGSPGNLMDFIVREVNKEDDGFEIVGDIPSSGWGEHGHFFKLTKQQAEDLVNNGEVFYIDDDGGHVEIDLYAFSDIDAKIKSKLNKKAILTQKVNPKTKKKEWALVSKSDPSKVLKYFGTEKPSKERVQKEERRVQYFKHKGSLNKEAGIQEWLGQFSETLNKILESQNIEKAKEWVRRNWENIKGYGMEWTQKMKDFIQMIKPEDVAQELLSVTTASLRNMNKISEKLEIDDESYVLDFLQTIAEYDGGVEEVVKEEGYKYKYTSFGWIDVRFPKDKISEKYDVDEVFQMLTKNNNDWAEIYIDLMDKEKDEFIVGDEPEITNVSVSQTADDIIISIEWQADYSEMESELEMHKHMTPEQEHYSKLNKESKGGYPNDINKCRSCVWFNTDVTLDGNTGFFGKCSGCIHAYTEEEIKNMPKEDREELQDYFESREGSTNPVNIPNYETKKANKLIKAEDGMNEYKYDINIYDAQTNELIETVYENDEETAIETAKFIGNEYDRPVYAVVIDNETGDDIFTTPKSLVGKYNPPTIKDVAREFNITEEDVYNLLDKPLSELRKMQDIVKKQMELTRNEDVMSRLQQRDYLYQQIVDMKEFPEDYQVQAKLNKEAETDLEIGKEIEMEHEPTYKKIKKDVEEDQDLDMTVEEMAESISKDHLNEFKNYYDKKKGLPNMEKELEEDEEDSDQSEIKPISNKDKKRMNKKAKNYIGQYNGTWEFIDDIADLILEGYEINEIKQKIKEKYEDVPDDAIEYGIEEIIDPRFRYNLVNRSKNKILENGLTLKEGWEKLRELEKQNPDDDYILTGYKPSDSDIIIKNYSQNKRQLKKKSQNVFDNIDSIEIKRVEGKFNDDFTIKEFKTPEEVSNYLYHQDKPEMGYNKFDVLIHLKNGEDIKMRYDHGKQDPDFISQLLFFLNNEKVSYNKRQLKKAEDKRILSKNKRLKRKADSSGGTQPLYEVKCPNCGQTIEITPGEKAISNRVYCDKCKKSFEPRKYKPKSIKNKVFPDMKFKDIENKSVELDPIYK